MNTYLLRLFSVCLCLGVLMLINSVIPLPTNTAQAENHINYSNVNYTNIFINKTYMDIIRADRDFVLPARDLDFGIQISKTCYNIHKFAPVNSTTKCPTYESIMAIFPDTSNQDVSGAFVYKDNMLQRERPPMEKSYNYYAFKNETFLFIDPDAETSKSLGMIVIESSLKHYPIDYKMSNNTRVMGEGRYIDDCRNAVISAEDWIFLLGDTIEFMRHDCHPTYTLYNETRMIYTNYTKHDITTSNKWLHDQFIQWVKDNCLLEYDKC